MNKGQKLRVCNFALLAVTVIMLASAIQLEATGSASSVWVWIHTALGLIFSWLIWVHMKFHFKSGVIKGIMSRRGHGFVKWLAGFAALVLLTGIAAAIHRLVTGSHIGIGAVHGKIGFIFLIMSAVHIVRHRRFFGPRKKMKNPTGK